MPTETYGAAGSLLLLRFVVFLALIGIFYSVKNVLFAINILRIFMLYGVLLRKTFSIRACSLSFARAGVLSKYKLLKSAANPNNGCGVSCFGGLKTLRDTINCSH